MKFRVFSRTFYQRPVLCVCVSVCVSLCVNHLLVRVITRDPFKLGSPNLDQRCKRPWFKSLLFWGAIALTFRVKFNLKSEFTPFWACPHYNSLPIQARITKFGPIMQNSLVKIPIVLGGNWPWPSRSNLTEKNQIFWSHQYWKHITTI